MTINRMKVLAVVMALSLLFVGGALTSTVQAAPWISPTPEIERYAADWVTAVQNELTGSDLRWTFANDPRNPQAAILKMLNQAAVAMKDGNTGLAKDFVARVFSILEEGAELGYYTSDEMSSVKQAIERHLPKALV
ncbi:MAG: hypothetical protein D6704_11330 [Nitrospirae bacterium]|nr:MAG: hypothetical protein D6704_11330 [Nitrospirota bacterium]